MERVKALGGIFFKSENPHLLREWYKKHLGIDSETWGAVFKWQMPENREYYNVWSPFSSDTKYFSPSTKPFMINFIVEDCFALLDVLKKEGVTLTREREESEFGRFGWILDPEGNKIELWEPPLKQ
jgi:predicted enzyme related to lactoylglutathione lyase